MKRIAQVGLGVAFALAMTVAAQAQPTPVTTDSGTSTKPLSSQDLKKIKTCQAMDHGKMMSNHGCRQMMKLHPDMMGTDPTSESH